MGSRECVSDQVGSAVGSSESVYQIRSGQGRAGWVSMVMKTPQTCLIGSPQIGHTDWF